MVLILVDSRYADEDSLVVGLIVDAHTEDVERYIRADLLEIRRRRCGHAVDLGLGLGGLFLIIMVVSQHGEDERHDDDDHSPDDEAAAPFFIRFPYHHHTFFAAFMARMRLLRLMTVPT